MQTQDVALSHQFVDESIGIRSYALHVADLAATLARNGGAPPQRPLSREQIERAIEVNGVETRMVMEALISRLEHLLREGKLPKDAAVPLW